MIIKTAVLALLMMHVQADAGEDAQMAALQKQLEALKAKEAQEKKDAEAAAAQKAIDDKAKADAAAQQQAIDQVSKATRDDGFSWDNIKKNFEEEEEVIEDDWDEAKQEWNADMPKYDSHHFDGKKPGLWSYWNYFRWILNAAFVGLPLTVIGVAAAVLNIWTSADWNKWWAYGNLFMVSKTFYVVFQTLQMIPVVFEIDVYMRHFKPMRGISLMWAIFYLIMWVSAIVFWYIEIYNPPSWLKWDFPTVMFNLFLSYNFVFDTLGVPQSFAIIVKEITLEFFQLVKGETSDANHNTDISLHLVDLADSWVDIAFMLNPFNLMVFFWKFLTGKIDATDLEGNKH